MSPVSLLTYFQYKLLTSAEDDSNLAASRLHVLGPGSEEGARCLSVCVAQVFTGNHHGETEVAPEDQGAPA